MSDRLLSGVTDQHSDHSGYGSYAAYDVLDPYGTTPQQAAPTQQWGDPAQGQQHGGYGEWGAEGQWAAEPQQVATATIPPQQGVEDWYLQQQAGQWDAGGYGAGDLHETPAQGVAAYQDLQGQQGHQDQQGYQEYDGTYGAAYGPEFHQQPAAGYGEQAEADRGAAAYDAAGNYDATPEFEAAPQAEQPDAAYDITPSTGFEVEPEPELATAADALPDSAAPADSVDAPDAPAPAGASRSQGRGRRRVSRPRARSAFLSVAAPSLAVLGVTAVATAATVSESGTDTANEPAPVAAPDPADEAQRAAANAEFDTQLTSVQAAAGDYAERASRTQGRIDLEAQQEAEAEAAAAEAARIEAMRPKFFLPVEQRGLSAYYGQAGVNWMSNHTGIDFPVSYGTPVLAATDGTVRTQWHPSYGNLLILTAADGTETWYAHLDSTAYQSGSVQAGTVIAYSGNSGNSTGPHLHFEVRPGGGSPIDPLTWLRNQGLEPT
ncbi:M23 family metallopeptidase [Streptomyces millisiae]|uniref:M23 family metallopeptidase n=1 Tax=Streptomyces millisiae TaxID=3075542 RepID=A0ABU2M0P3_9ACTN|nr:M23 family metallopeptidase [Streptomyces sp. DSM 44918]MDT0322962.1 M23 family metallopeptidase [Streptomyces sp. DSM 44918]